MERECTAEHIYLLLIYPISHSNSVTVGLFKQFNYDVNIERYGLLVLRFYETNPLFVNLKINSKRVVFRIIKI